VLYRSWTFEEEVKRPACLGYLRLIYLLVTTATTNTAATIRAVRFVFSFWVARSILVGALSLVGI